MADDIPHPTKAQAKEAQEAPPSTLPSYYGSGFHLMSLGIDFMIIFRESKPILMADGSLNTTFLRNFSSHSVTMPPGCAKDLLLVLQDQIKAYEEIYGEIKTDLTIARAKQPAEDV